MDDPRLPPSLTPDQIAELRIARGDPTAHTPPARLQTSRQDRVLLVALKLLERRRGAWQLTEYGRTYLDRVEHDGEAGLVVAPPAAEAYRRQEPARRKCDILAAAAHAFADSGFRGASLRDIALQAGVSLPLLSHHFGSKASLLQAVVDDHHKACSERMVALRALVIGAGDAIALGTLVDEWVRYEYAMYTSAGGRHYLQLMLKLAAEPEVDVAIQRRLDCSEAVVLRGFERAAPRSSQASRQRAFSAASSSLHAGIRDSGLALDDSRPAVHDDAIAFTSRFLVAALAVSLA